MTHGDTIQTPNGAGKFLKHVYEQGVKRYVVQHDPRKMTGRKAGERIDVGPGVAFQIWRYEQGEVME